jgi:secreted PhoX family phosphatase
MPANHRDRAQSSSSRRSFLRYVGAGATAWLAGPALGPLLRAATPSSSHWVRSDGAPAWAKLPYPVPLPGDEGDASGDPARLAKYDVLDALRLPDGYTFDVLATWGESFGPADRPERQIQFGHNADYTGLTPIPGQPGEYYLIVNHEYVSARPWLQAYNASRAPADIRMSLDDAVNFPDGRLQVAGVTFDGPRLDLETHLRAHEAAGLSDIERLERLTNRSKLPAPVFETIRDVCRAALADVGVSIVHVRATKDRGFEVVRYSDRHLRFSGPTPSKRDRRRERFAISGPVAALMPVPGGTFNNCSGATTPWGTFLTCEENYQDYVADAVTPDGRQLETATCAFGGQIGNGEHPLPFEFYGLGQGSLLDIDPRGYGWVCEVNPTTGVLTKHTSLGRFRHENVALRVEAGKPVVAYMGDDRRGGHVWKFVSEAIVNDPGDARNSELLNKGSLYVARFEANFSGSWIPLRPDTPLRRPEPEHLATCHLQLPWRPHGGRVGVGLPSSKYTEVSPRRWMASIEQYTNRKYDDCRLQHLVSGGDSLAALLIDAYAYGNAVGGTPCSRPEDIEIHPRDKSVYVAFTDSTGSGDGSPDVRIFPDSAGKNSRQYGAIYRIAEDHDGDPASSTFTWGKFVSSGEAFEGGGGFACADNLVFDADGNLWMVCDITTPAHNFPVNRAESATAPGAKNFPGVFGNNAMFMIPTTGPHAGVPFCFAIGPMECELTGPTFSPDGRTLILSVQHPGELYGTRSHWASSLPPTVVRGVQIATRDGKPFTQKRTVPLGSNFPTGRPGEVPRSCVVCIRRA